MNMEHSLGIMDVLVFGAVAFSGLFTIAWSLSPKLREWIERPKYQFQDNLERQEKLR
jgi:hypothetical protein